MKHILSLLLLTALFGIPAGCDDPSESEANRISVTYEIDRKFQWNPAEKKFSGTILVKNSATLRGMQLASNTYGLTFSLIPGERTTIITKSDEEGTCYNGEYPELPVLLPQLMDRQSPATICELFDYDVRAVCELELSAVAIEGKYYFVFNSYDVPSTWFFCTSFEIEENLPFNDEKFVTLSAGKVEFRRKL